VVKVIKTSDFEPDSALSIYMDGDSGRALAFIENDEL
jgi:hypothetical protein